MEAKKILMQKFVAGLEIARDSAIKQGSLDLYNRNLAKYENNVDLKDLFYPEEYSKCLMILQILEGKDLLETTFKGISELDIKLNGIILINVISKTKPCIYCDQWVKSSDYSRILALKDILVITFNYDWEPMPCLPNICLSGLNNKIKFSTKNKLCLFPFFPLFICLSNDIGYICRDIYVPPLKDLFISPDLSSGFLINPLLYSIVKSKIA